jgi:hypothetical protein
MAIQFPCGQCGKLIEVDDDQAGQAATCPYCLKAISVPRTSVLPTAAALETEGPAAGPSPAVLGYSTQAPAVRSKARFFGWIALAAVLLAGACMVYSIAVGYSIAQGLNMQQVKTPDDMAQFKKEVQARMQARPDAIVAGFAGACVLPLVGVVCAIIALVARAQPRWPAIVALCLIGLLVILVCGGMLVQAMQRAPATS